MSWEYHHQNPMIILDMGWLKKTKKTLKITLFVYEICDIKRIATDGDIQKSAKIVKNTRKKPQNHHIKKMDKFVFFKKCKIGMINLYS
jgi:hypothetical protein